MFGTITLYPLEFSGFIRQSLAAGILDKQKMSLAGINLIISTVERPNQYVHTLLSHLGKDIPIRLVVGSPKYGYLERYRQNANIEIIGIEAAEWDRFKKYDVIHRASWNYWRCFTYGVRPEARKGLLILEDDVIPAIGWEERLRQTTEQIESQYGQEYVLALYNGYMDLSKTKVPGKYYVSYPASRYGGAQAMYFPDEIRVGWTAYLRREGVDQIRLPLDYLLGEYLRLTGIPLFATTPSLFQHNGAVTTGLSPGFHRAGYFEKDLRKLPKKIRS